MGVGYDHGVVEEGNFVVKVQDKLALTLLEEVAGPVLKDENVLELLDGSDVMVLLMTELVSGEIEELIDNVVLDTFAVVDIAKLLEELSITVLLEVVESLLLDEKEEDELMPEVEDGISMLLEDELVPTLLNDEVVSDELELEIVPGVLEDVDKLVLVDDANSSVVLVEELPVLLDEDLLTELGKLKPLDLVEVIELRVARDKVELPLMMDDELPMLLVEELAIELLLITDDD